MEKKVKAKNSNKSPVVLIYGILSIILSFAFCGWCIYLDITKAVSHSVAPAMCFAALIFGFIGFVWASLTTKDENSRFSFATIICSIISVTISVYSVILYADMTRIWKSIFGAFGML